MLLIDLVLLLIAVVMLLPSATLFIECGSALRVSLRKSEEVHSFSSSDPVPKFAVLVPAHNEAIGIGTTLKTLLCEVDDPVHIVLIADNCTDNTAAVARSFGVTVVERQDLQHQGKGYALDYGLNYLESAQLDVLVMVDADCVVSPGSLLQIVRLAFWQNRPVQAVYLMEPPVSSSQKDSISTLAFLVKNWVRPAGLAQFGLPCLLTGTGMAFPWSVIRQVSLASGNLVEDMQLSVDLAIAGYPPQFCAEARVTGCLPQQQSSAKSQRTRWEHGHLQTLQTQLPRLLKSALVQKRWDLLVLALDLFIPPLALLVLLWVGAIALALLAAALGASWNPVMILLVSGLLLFTAVLASWGKFGRSRLPLSTLLSIPLYILWKIPLYFAFLFRRQTQWIRTERDLISSPDD